MIKWQASASLPQIQLRAAVLKQIRTFFAQQGVLEVDTPCLSVSTTPDPFIESFHSRYTPLTQVTANENYYLHTSPEFPMKRLLASGSGSIYQVCKVFRQGEIGRKHNPEFTLLEWYREGWDHHQLMQEVGQLLADLIAPYRHLSGVSLLTYKAAFQQKLGINPHTASQAELIACTQKVGLDKVLDADEHRDRYLELLFSHVIEPELGIDNGMTSICLLYDYPASQASLARIKRHDGDLIAERFEVFIEGMELGNGFHELNDAKEQRRRFITDNQMRQARGMDEVPLDENFLAAVGHLPDCAGVAIGLERLLMVISQAQHINNVINFPFQRA
ncbi:EF-P lysine aminoacylase EpmA [sulfur-oxidizing endosymbiont of Gigantopelta aegis]|uniref:EF-P lysine aminoacylase EpmA n=1 Tax=sulfur-oxidizing endosymbiont of Gigantopelta aegis TaxID=2794934 RepID=UPI0018DB565F|nr:EF-P lysine aminoacylase EpmA [sulfur-oxidizing endosymbiont of Gigantopelta aegis]